MGRGDVKRQCLWLPFTLPSRNKLDSLRGRTFRGRGKRRDNAYNKRKKLHESQIRVQATSTKLLPIGPCYFTYLFLEKDRTRDPSNIMGGAVKLIEDALQMKDCEDKDNRILAGDGWRDVLGIRLYWGLAVPSPGPTGVFVIMDTEQEFDRQETLDLFRQNRGT